MNGTDPTLLLQGAQLTTLNYSGGDLDVTDPAINTTDRTLHQAWFTELSDKARYTVPGTNPPLTWFDRTLDYICDEPSRPGSTCRWTLTGQTNDTCANASTPPTMLHLRATNANAFGFSTFVASSMEDVQCHDTTWQSDLKIIGPVVDQMDVKDPNENGVHLLDSNGQVKKGSQRSRYLDAAATWWYVSCDLQGCAFNASNPITANPLFYDNWPSYSVDAPRMHQHRALEWLSYANDASGEFYWDVVSQLPSAWQGMPNANGIGPNGDGDLLYPGTPAAPSTSGMSLGGTRDIPIASMRLKMIREGMEDYEYLKMVERLDPASGRAYSMNQARPLFAPGASLGTSPVEFHAFNAGKGAGMLAARTPPDDLMTARRNLAGQIKQLATDHGISLKLVNNTSTAATYQVLTSSTPVGAQLSLTAPWSAVHLEPANASAGSPSVYATVNAACPAAQSSAFTVVAKRSITGQERVATALLPGSFSISVNPPVTMTANSTAQLTVTTTPAAGTAGQVIQSFAVSKLPPGLTGTVTPTSVQAGQSATLTLTADASAPGSAYPVSFSVQANGCEQKIGSQTVQMNGPASSGGRCGVGYINCCGDGFICRTSCSGVICK
jgi:hypothetical protein